MKKLLFVLLLSGCASTESGKDVGPYAVAEYTIPACSKVTVSSYAGAHRWIECQVR